MAIAYAMGFEDMSRLAQEVTPFAFPAVAIGAPWLLARTGRPLWQAEAAGLVGQVALAAAFVTLAGVLDPQNPAAFGALCGLAATIEVLVCHRLIGSVRLTGWGFSASVVALVSFGAASVGDRSSGDSPIGAAGDAADRGGWGRPSGGLAGRPAQRLRATRGAHGEPAGLRGGGGGAADR